jgi:serine protease Do
MASVRPVAFPVAFLAALSALSFGTVAAAAPARTTGNLPPLAPAPDDDVPVLRATGPGPAQAAAPAAAAAPTAPGTPAPDALERVRRGVVLIERDGKLLGFGTVLGGDGRILTSLSALGASDKVDVHYADGALVHAQVGHKDAAWDLALLVPRSIHWKDGLSASGLDPSSADLRAPIPLRIGARPIALPVHFKGRMDAISRQGESLLNALDIEVRQMLPVAGAPILDQQATVIGVLVRACKLAVGPVSPADGKAGAGTGTFACAPTLIGAPVSALRSFLSSTPATAVAPTPWLGIAGEQDASGPVHGVKIMAVAPKSPAELAGLHKADGNSAGDRIVAVDGHPVDTPERLADAIGRHAVGDAVKLLVLRGDYSSETPETPTSFREVSVVLRSAPSP